LYEINLTQPLALIFGNEHSGVSEEIRRLADGNFIIPQVGIIRSLNISVACAVTLYEAYRQKTVAGHFDKTKLNGEVLKELMDKWGYEDETNQ
jgi:tRNA (guanosine-2'-O-)-methyltransferase